MQLVIKKEGFSFAFDPNACASCNGACCRGESGYIWVSKQEIEAIAQFLQLSTQDFISNYLKKEGYRYSIKEIKSKGEHFCIFFEEGRGCSIYPVRPKQCRDYPFWKRYKDKKNISEVCQECKGILLHYS
ncbi:hypothetical protein NitYY0826_C1106 [Nitratiruptor sp. YY08-26]|uniref:YkgJ family cysteine cluster protein n=1 Tax=unclassified Nitratiruptor TaxID=2624044 RepID=UPI0019165B40|nr:MULTISPECIES: YkgJ family cysteine cluster protein [unclassified Nitratiruptor]BCD62230.1 hypothetical protein NitYY0813_C1104 [Nitratiruptor sp. YY08-13]BCD66166.1 hypothetical protein NitYY0826_C1106 [Nitratiruptor sp. YY08-26]